MVNQSKYQKFEMDTVSRKQIHGADYNPRVISEDARKRLRKMLAKHGLSSRWSGIAAPETLFPGIKDFRLWIPLSVHKIIRYRLLLLT